MMHKKHNPAFTDDEDKVLTNYQKKLDVATKFIPLWVKVAVALALGMGTMVGWKRIVVTVGEKIGKDHLTYAQGASAELVAMATIIAADNFGLPVSTTHVLSSGIAGTMVANGSGLQWSTLRSIAMAWVLHAAGSRSALRWLVLALPPLQLLASNGEFAGVRSSGRPFCFSAEFGRKTRAVLPGTTLYLPIFLSRLDSIPQIPQGIAASGTIPKVPV
jgi:hypothetical protein